MKWTLSQGNGSLSILRDFRCEWSVGFIEGLGLLDTGGTTEAKVMVGPIAGGVRAAVPGIGMAGVPIP